MHIDLPHLTWSGPPIDDEAILARLPEQLAAALRDRNGCIAYRGGFHVRGACREPSWHSLRAACEGNDAFHVLYEEVLDTDVPFAEDGLGDQFLVRGGEVWHLWAETGEVEAMSPSLEAFFDAITSQATEVLSLEPVMAFLDAGQELKPGQLLMAYPPFCVSQSDQGVTLTAISTAERREFLATIARQIHDLPDGAEVQFKVEG
jgi:hypothetical protein